MRPKDEFETDWIAGIAERKIADAIDQGLFDNLPGKGKPLVLDDDSLTPAASRVGNRILKNAGVVPDWVSFEGEIDAAKATAAAFLAKWSQHSPETPPERLLNAKDEYQRLLKDANHLILKYSMVSPFLHRSPVPYRIREKLLEWDALVESAASSGKAA